MNEWPKHWVTILLGADDGAVSVTRPLSVRGDNLTNKLLLVGDDAGSSSSLTTWWLLAHWAAPGCMDWIAGGEEEIRVTSLITSLVTSLLSVALSSVCYVCGRGGAPTNWSPLSCLCPAVSLVSTLLLSSPPPPPSNNLLRTHRTTEDLHEIRWTS